jgi:AmmeMemoRadiSam system protein B/AmmeMemoRadiSam system protein A
MSTLAPATAERPELTDVQKRAIVAAAAEYVAAAATDRSPTLADPHLAGAAQHLVAGVFVSLKRDSHLRGCTGGIRNEPVYLKSALADAAESCVLRDQRFPVVSPGEVASLDLEVWLLSLPRVLEEKGEDRAAAVVTGGKHGVIIKRGGQHGLLLPGVAAEHDWDSRTFLEHACQKAGLHPSLWKDDDTTVSVFEGEELIGRVGDYVEAMVAPPIVDREELSRLFDFCWDNIVALFRREMIKYFHPGLRDVAVHGVLLRLKAPAAPEPIQLVNVSLRSGSPVQNTLVQFAQLGAHQLAAHGIRLDTLHTVGMGLTVFGDPQMHGTVARSDLRGFDSEARTIMIVERNKQSVVWHPSLTADELVAAATKLARVNQPEFASVFSVQAISTDKSVSFASVPLPKRGPAERPPGVAGLFYPGEALSLSQTVTDILHAAEKYAQPKRTVAAAMIPHAGLRYSGVIAAQTFLSIDLPRNIIVIGPKHTGNGVDWAVAPHQTWQIPGAEISADFMLARKLSQAIDGLELDAAAHQKEHAIEVELPLLARLAPQSRVTGIALAGGDWAAAQRFAEGLAAVVKEMPEAPLLLVSSDMNHFATDDENRRLDEMAIAALETLDPEHAFRVINENNITMCGVFPAVIVMETLRRLGHLTRTVRTGYATSADVSGDTDRVVGYAGMLFET